MGKASMSGTAFQVVLTGSLFREKKSLDKGDLPRNSAVNAKCYYRIFGDRMSTTGDILFVVKYSCKRVRMTF